MKWGMIGRADSHGLGNMTSEIARHLRPDRTLVVVPRSPAGHCLAQDFSRFTDPLVLQFDGRLDEPQVRGWLDGLDVLYTAETLYDWRIADWARDAGVRTVVHVMPEYFKHGAHPELPKPDVWWAPTSWRLDRLPAGTRLVELPIAVDRWPDPDLTVGCPPRWLFVAGARAALDRNGTRIVLQALRLLRREHTVVVRAHDEDIASVDPGRHVHLEQHTTGVRDYWDLYTGADALLMPRRYGGLCLPALEAMGAGMALVMPNVAPQCSEWPIMPVRAPWVNHIVTSAGEIPLCAPEPEHLAHLMDQAADDPTLLQAKRCDSRAFAEAHSWQRLGPKFLAALEEAAA